MSSPILPVKEIPYEIARRFNVPIITRETAARRALRWNLGPASAGIVVNGSAVVDDQEGHEEYEYWFHLAHEITHAVFWHPKYGVYVDETLMVPWEYATFRTLGGPRAGVAFMKAEYTTNTRVTEDGIEVGSHVRPRRAAWWRKTVKLNIHLGVMHDINTPTWERPDWGRVDLDSMDIP